MVPSFAMVRSGKARHRETKFWLYTLFFSDWEEFQTKHLLHAEALTTTLPSVLPFRWCPSPKGFIPLSSHLGPHHFRWSLALG